MFSLSIFGALAQSLFLVYSKAEQVPFQAPLHDILPKSGYRILHDAHTTRTYSWNQSDCTGWPDNDKAHIFFTNAMGHLMESRNISQAQLSVARNGIQLYNAGFTWLDTYPPQTRYDDRFLLGSTSKIFCVAAIQTLLHDGRLHPETRVYERLGYNSSNTKVSDHRVWDITVENLLDHYGGDDRNNTYDVMWDMRDIALAVNGGAHPLTERELVTYKITKPLRSKPGDIYIYSNYGYFLLGYLVEIVSGQSFYDFLSKNVLEPNDLDVQPWLTAEKYHMDDNVHQWVRQERCEGLSALDPLSNVKTPCVYGGDGNYKDISLSAFALAASASTLARMVAKYPVWGWYDGRAPNYSRIGSIPGAHTHVWSRLDGLDYAVTFNTREWAWVGNKFNETSMTEWLEHNIGGYLTQTKPHL